MPLSPNKRTVAEVDAAFAMASKILNITLDSPIMLYVEEGFLSVCICTVLRMCNLLSTRLTAEKSSSSVKGLVRYSSAPVLMALTAPLTVAYPVIIITSVFLKLSRTCLTRSSPLTFGILKSVITKSIIVVSKISIASATPRTVKTTYPLDLRFL